jgi:hypothetical protein
MTCDNDELAQLAKVPDFANKLNSRLECALYQRRVNGPSLSNRELAASPLSDLLLAQLTETRHVCCCGL